MVVHVMPLITVLVPVAGKACCVKDVSETISKVTYCNPFTIPII